MPLLTLEGWTSLGLARCSAFGTTRSDCGVAISFGAGSKHWDCREHGFLVHHGRQRTDSTHVLGAVRALNRLGCAIETLRAALNVLAAAASDWLRQHADPAWTERYERRADDIYVPKGEAARRAFAETVGRDGDALLKVLTAPDAPYKAARGARRRGAASRVGADLLLDER